MTLVSRKQPKKCPKIVLTRFDASVLQVLDVAGVPKGARLGPPGLPGEGAGQCHGVILRGQARESVLLEATLLAISPAGDVRDLLVIIALEHSVGHALKGPGLVPAVGDVASQADLLEVRGAISWGKGIAPSLGISVQFEAPLSAVIYRESRAI